MDVFLPELRQYLKQHRQSLTKPRLAVFRALYGSEPLTMARLVKTCEGIDRASVYRTVALFEKIGVIERLQIGWKYKLELSDRFGRHHHHLTCLRCGRVIAFDETAELDKELRRIADDSRFKMQNHQLEIQGLCHGCAGNQVVTPPLAAVLRA